MCPLKAEFLSLGACSTCFYGIFGVGEFVVLHRRVKEEVFVSLARDNLLLRQNAEQRKTFPFFSKSSSMFRYYRYRTKAWKLSERKATMSELRLENGLGGMCESCIRRYQVKVPTCTLENYVDVRTSKSGTYISTTYISTNQALCIVGFPEHTQHVRFLDLYLLL